MDSIYRKLACGDCRPSMTVWRTCAIKKDSTRPASCPRRAGNNAGDSNRGFCLPHERYSRKADGIGRSPRDTTEQQRAPDCRSKSCSIPKYERNYLLAERKYVRAGNQVRARWPDPPSREFANGAPWAVCLLRFPMYVTPKSGSPETKAFQDGNPHVGIRPLVGTTRSPTGPGAPPEIDACWRV